MACKLKVATWNANSLKNKQAAVIHYLLSNKVDVFLINETKLKPEQRFRIKGYRVIRKDRVSEHAAGGVCAAVRDGISVEVLSMPDTSLETLGFRLPDKTVVIAAYNRPSNNFPEHDLRKLLGVSSKVLLVGDLNARNKLWDSHCATNNTNGRTVEAVLCATNSNVLFPDEPTFTPFNQSTPSVLDLVISRNVTGVTTPVSLAQLDSDHNVVEFLLTCACQKEVRDKRIFISYENTDWQECRKYLDRKIDIDAHIDNVEELESAVHTFTAILAKAKDKFSHRKVIDGYRDRLPPDVVKMIAHKNRLRKTWQQSASAIDLANYRAKIREVSAAVSNYRDDVWRRRLASLSVEDNSLWKLVKRLKQVREPLPTLRDGQTTAASDSEKAEMIANEFKDIGSRIISELTDPTLHAGIDDHVREFLNRNTNTPVSEAQLADLITSPTELERVIKKLPNNKAPGEDGIDNRLLKNLSRKALVQLVYILNAMFKLKHFPTSWKKAVAVPIPKPGKDISKPENYRIICLLNALSKLAEKVILKRIDKHDRLRRISADEQFGFRKKHSTCMQVVRIVIEAVTAFNKKHNTQLVLLDIQKAFDSVWIDGLLYKLIQYRLPKPIIVLVHSYLTGRRVAVKVNSSLSAVKEIKAGVPQGSALSPRLFSLYINDTPKLPTTNLALYADDTALYHSSFSAEIANRQLQIHVRLLEKYYKKWKIKLNSDKTESITFSRKFTNNVIRQPLVVGGKPVPVSPTAKYLGVTLDSRLNFRAHLEKALHKVYGAMRTIYPLMRGASLSQANKKTLYTGIIRPALVYGAPVWGNISDTQFLKLQRFQNKCLRLITSRSRYTRIDTLHQLTDIPYIKDLVRGLSSDFYAKQIAHSRLTRDITSTQIRNPDVRFKHKLPYSETVFRDT